jgi:hypothetical protein
METKPYFSHQLPNTLTLFIGTEKSQVIKTLEYYKFERGQSRIAIPDEKELLNLEGVIISCAFPLLNKDQFIEATVRENVRFDVNANFYQEIQKIAANYKELKRAELYKFDPGLELFGLWFLPEYIMQGLQEYNWKQHEEQVNEWLKVRAAAIEGGKHLGLASTQGEQPQQSIIVRKKRVVLAVPAGSKSSDRTH